MQRADLESAAIGRRSATLRVQPLGGGVRLNNQKIGHGYGDYNEQCCTLAMRCAHRGVKKENRPAAPKRAQAALSSQMALSSSIDLVNQQVPSST